jgi:hypothetical protein
MAFMRYGSMDPDDRYMLTELLATSKKWEEEHDEEETRFRSNVFQSWLDAGKPLSDKQRSWLTDTYERVVGAPRYENLVSSGKVPRGREVTVNVGPKVLRPPGRTV